MSATSTSSSARQGGPNVFLIALICLVIVLIGLGTFAAISLTGGAAPQPAGAGVYDMPTKF